MQKVDSRRIPQGDVESKLANLRTTKTFTQFVRRQSSLSQAWNSILEAYFANQTYHMSQALVKPGNLFYFKNSSSELKPLVKPKTAFFFNRTYPVSRA